eukprot:TRINITY_DN1567_c1_g2_i2.p1 TRINITY_DN1567_c1_g2~~TRINITY_DN1567_c1_g2_i2.p1  ORF type:complete len:944 (+),score=195.07 TRINITY_DN1567_c1_g2_i2:378-2834(+)
MMWYSSSLGTFWYAIFGRLQYAYVIAQDVIGILQAVMVARVAEALVQQGEPERIPATAIAVICLSSVIFGLSSIAIGKLGVGNLALLFPAPVTNGFLGAIGFVILRSSLQTASGVQFKYFYPVNMDAFLQPTSLMQLGLQVTTVIFMRSAPPLVEFCFPNWEALHKVAGAVIQLLPLALFHIVVAVSGISMDWLTENGWVYPKESAGGLLAHFTSYSLSDVDVPSLTSTLVDMPALVLLAVICTATGALTVHNRFPRGPAGDPAPLEPLDFDRELTTVGVGSVLLGATGGTCAFHTFTAIQLRFDGGTHRVAVLCVALFIFGTFASGIPFGHYVPKWFLSGLFMNTAFHFLKGTVFSYKSLPSHYWRGYKIMSVQYLISLATIVVSVFYSPTTAIFVGLVMSVCLFLWQSARSSPVINAVTGNHVISRTKRPIWEMQALNREGRRILILYLQGHLFFGSAQKLVSVLAAALADENVRYCILSFARVPSVDPSAARHLKTMREKAKLNGCRVMFCRTNHVVYSALVAAEVIQDPDRELLQVLRGLRWRTKATSDAEKDERDEEPDGLTKSLLRDQVAAAPAPEEPDAFAHETDALDFCDECLVREYCYGCGSSSIRLTLPRGLDLGPPAVCETGLLPYQLAYREACLNGTRLEERHFEEMNNLRPNFMAELRPHCQILENISKWERLPSAYGALIFILRGSVSLVQILAHAEHGRAHGSGMSQQAKGFSFREGKRLRRRYPPGHVVGKVTFFLSGASKVVDPQLAPQPIVSSKCGGIAELWVLQRSTWEGLPASLKAELTRMLCEQLADDAQHASLQEH